MSQSIRSHLSKKLQKSLRINSKGMGQFCYLRLFLAPNLFPVVFSRGKSQHELKFEKQEHYLYIWATALSVKTSAKN